MTTHLEAIEANGEQPWRDCLSNDWNGSTEAVRRLARRGREVAALHEMTARLRPWFEELADLYGI